MWKIKTFKTNEAKEAFILKNARRMQITEVFINNGYGVEYKPNIKIHL